MEYVTLSNGVKMPIMGYGVYQVTKDECERCVLDALKAGYRSLDTAQSYFNEEEVGSAIQKSGLQREEIFLTTKVWVEHYGFVINSNPPEHLPDILPFSFHLSPYRKFAQSFGDLLPSPYHFL